MSARITATEEKAKQINLDSRFYGTFAEIGAGQEVARWFFRVGGAAGTVAKSMSAYDMQFSDAIYGKGERYVSMDRLHHMLEYEYQLIMERLNEKRGAKSAFFVFANTVSARNYLGTNECHGWLGIKFQIQPNAEPNYVVIHVNMLDKENVQQQEALGIIGVNLIHSAFYLHSEPDLFITALRDGLTTDRIEVDMIKFYGPYFGNVDNRLMALTLVQEGLTDAALLAPNGEVIQPSEYFHKKNIVIERGSFRPVTYVNLDMLETARKESAPSNPPGTDTVEVMEITMRNLLATGEIDHRDFLSRADLIGAVGKAVLISNYAEYYRLAAYLWRYTKNRISIVVGIPNLREILDEKYYHTLEGGILESFGRLFKNDLKLFVYPFRDPSLGTTTTLMDMVVPKHLCHLFTHLRENGSVVPITGANPAYGHIFSRNVLAKIRNGEEDWESMVPPEVSQIIKDRHYFGYQA